MKKPSTKPAPSSMSYQNGAFVETAYVSAYDRGLLYGDGLFATIYVQDGEPRFLDDHLNQLKWQCAELDIIPPEIDPGVIAELIARCHLTSVGRMRIIITGGEDPGFGLPQRKGSLLITLKPFDLPEQKPLRLARFSTPLSLYHAHLKTLANFNRYCIVREAQSRGFDDGISISPKGYLLEASFGNLFWIIDETLYTPARTLPLYFGVTLQNVIKQWKGPVKEVRVKAIDRDAALFRCSSMLGIVPVQAIEEVDYMPSMPPMPPPSFGFRSPSATEAC